MPTTQEQVALLTDQVARLVALTGAILKGAVPDWVSGGSYVINQIRKSPADQTFYIANTTHSGVATDPSGDAVNWRSFVLDGFAPVSHQHSVSAITDFDPADYLARSGGVVTGNLTVRGDLDLRKSDGNSTSSFAYLNNASGPNYLIVPGPGGNLTVGEDPSTPWAVFTPPASAPGSNTVITRFKGDARYARTGGTQVPASVSSPGEAGQIIIGFSYIYACVATNTWRRALLSTW